MTTTRQTYEARIAAEQEHLLNVQKDWIAVVRAVRAMRDEQQIGREVCDVVEADVKVRLRPVEERLRQLASMERTVRVRQPDFASRPPVSVNDDDVATLTVRP